MIDWVPKLFIYFNRFNMSFYAVGRGRKIGVFKTWPECSEYVKNFRDAKFKKFSTEAAAWDFVHQFNKEILSNHNDKVSDGEKVTSEEPKSLTSEFCLKVTSEEPKSLISEFCLKVQTLEQKHGKVMHDVNEIKCYLHNLESDIKNIKEKGSEVLCYDKIFQESIKKLQIMEKEYEYYSTEFRKIKEYMKADHERELSCNSTSNPCSKEIKDITSLKRIQIMGTDSSLRKRKFTTSSISCEGNENEHKRIKCTNFNISPKTGFITNEDGFVEVYTDGACENNGRFKAKAGIGVWFGENHSLNISEPVKGRATNNMAEIQAASEAVNAAKKAGIKKLLIHTDSKFLIQCMNQWIHKWKINNWQLSTGQPVKNKEELIVLDNAVKGMEIKWNHVRGHRGILGNERADELARSGAERY